MAATAGKVSAGCCGTGIAGGRFTRDGAPPAPHEAEGDRSGWAWCAHGDDDAPGLFPDGVAMGEWHCTLPTRAKAARSRSAVTPGIGSPSAAPPEGASSPHASGSSQPSAPTMTAPAYQSRGLVIAGLLEGGRVPGLAGLWAAGAVAGTRGYIDSLRSGIEVAATVAERLRDAEAGRHPRGSESPQDGEQRS